MRLFTLLLLTLTCLGLQSQKLSKTEQKIIEIIQRDNEQAIRFLEQVVNINSGTMNFAGVKAVGDAFSNEFVQIGFETEWLDMSAANRSGHLFAEVKGNKGKKLLLIGHLDTVFEKDSPFQSFKRQDSIAYGPGANDMKGGDVIVLYALRALYEVGALKDRQIIVAFTGDEESTGSPLSITRDPLIDAARRSDIALGFETSTGFNYATVARRGSSGWKLETTGRRSHSSGIFNERVGAGAIFEMARILNGFYEEVKGEEYLTFNPGVLLGGTTISYDDLMSKGEVFGKSNVVAQTATVTGGLRFISEEQKENAREKMKSIVASHLPHTDATITFTDSYPAMPPTEGNLALLDVLNQVSSKLGQGEVQAYNPGRRGAADVSFVADYVDALDGLGTMGTGAHTPNETVDLRTVEELTKRTALLIYQLTR
jgi:glutamate carboxypeptidase